MSCLLFYRKLRGLKCFESFNRVRGWFDTDFKANFTVSIEDLFLETLYQTVLFSLLFFPPPGIRQFVLDPQKSGASLLMEFCW